jgi:hypothetical protein
MKSNSFLAFEQCGCEVGRKLLLYAHPQERRNKS